MKNFLARFHEHDTIIQIGSKKFVKCINGDDLDMFLRQNQNEDIYFCAGVKPATKYARCADADIIKKNYFAIDLDLRDKYPEISNEEIKNFANVLKAQMSKSEDFKDWSYIVFSGNGIHIYFIGDTISGADLENYKSGVEYFYDRFDNEFGEKPDPACCNLARILRLPTTFNNKHGKHVEVEIIFKQKKHSKLLARIPEEGAARKAKEDVYKQDFDHSRVVGNIFDEINKISIFDLVEKHFGWRNNGRRFFEGDKKTDKGCFVPRGENFIVHAGTEHFEDAQKGYSSFSFIKEVKKLSVKETLAWFKKEYQHIADFKEPKVEFREKSDTVDSYTWGLDEIDAKITTPKKKEVFVLVADECQGKSTFCYFFARENKKKYKHNVVYFNLESEKEYVINNMATQFSKATKLEVRDNKHYKMQRYQQRKKELETQDDIIFIGKKKGVIIDMDYIEKTVSSLGKIDYLIIDNLTCISMKERKTESEEIKEIVICLIGMAEQMNIPILLVHHYKKRQDKSRKLFRDLHDMSGSRVLKDLIPIIIQVALNPDPKTQRERAEFHLREGKLRRGDTKESVMVRHENCDFFPVAIATQSAGCPVWNSFPDL